MTDPPFYRIGPERPVLPVILSVPHAGRAYPPALVEAARVPLSVLETLEDRLVDRLIWRAVATGATAFVATLPRASIDLNRDEREVDPAMVAPPPPAHALLPSARTRGGLGLVPARLAGAGALWRGRISREELNRRVETVHRPFHSALDSALTAARQRFGAAILLDCHSMPPRPQGEAKVIFGDRHGRTIAPALLEAALAATRSLGFSASCNEPYAGGHVIERHGRPGAQTHALQIEVDRSTYLDPTLRDPGPGFDSVARLIAAVVDALNEAVTAPPSAIAAE
jgi:N-formylglutamate amidohydrolase